MDSGYIFKCLLLSIIVFILILSNISIVFGLQSNDLDEDSDGLKDWEEELIGSNKTNPKSPGLYCLYKDRYKTKNYNSWELFSDKNGSLTLGLSRIVIRRGTTVELGGYTGGDLNIKPTKMNMDELSSKNWKIDIPEDNSVGRYQITIKDGSWQKTMDLFVVFDPYKTDLSEDNIDGYAYDENGKRDERGYIYTNSNNLIKGNLYPFGDNNENITDIYEFALAGVGNTSDPILASIKLVRIVAQRNTANPKEPPQLRDPRSILFFNQGKIQGLTLEDAKKLSMNGINRDNLADPGYTKTLGAWCDECAFALTGLLRSIGVPSRIVSAHPSKETKLMGHYISEAWFEESMYNAKWIKNDGNWYALDADEWNAEWDTTPKFWMPMGECFSSRSNYGFAAEHLFRVNYQYEVAHYYVLGPRDIEKPKLIDVTNKYKDKNFINLKYGSLSKFKARGSGDFYKINVHNYSKLTINSNGGIDPNIYMNKDDFPALKVSYQGYPPESNNKNFSGKQIILKPGEYYIAVFAPEVGSNSLEGNYGKYTLKLEKTSKREENDEKNIELDTYKYLVSFVLILTWIFSLIILKYY